VGVTLRLRAPDAAGCDVRIDEAVLEAGGERVAARPSGAGRHLYLSFPFDANRAWNRGVRRATLTVRGRSDVPLEIRILLEQRLERFVVGPDAGAADGGHR
jgi:hypothetical protein